MEVIGSFESDSDEDTNIFDSRAQITTRLDTAENHRRQLNQYIRGGRIGKGRHADVYLCKDQIKGSKVAIKVVKRNHPRDRIKLLRRNHQKSELILRNTNDDRPPLSTTENSIRREIAILKKCHHANLARLIEFIDDPEQEKVYMVIEYLPGGPIQWSTVDRKPILKVDQTRRILRDVIMGMEYLHHHGIVHRDIKPANLMYTKDRTRVKIVDFGVSHYSLPQLTSPVGTPFPSEEHLALFPETDLLKRIGTPSFLAPEIVWFFDTSEISSSVENENPLASGLTNTHSSLMNLFSAGKSTAKRPPVTKAIDVWALGVTFFCLLFGRTPFNVDSTNESPHHNEFMLYHLICLQDWSVDETMGADKVATGGRHPQGSSQEGSAVIFMLEQMLQKDPGSRITVAALKRHPWVLQNIDDPKEWLQITSPVKLQVEVDDSTDERPERTPRWMKLMGQTVLKLIPGSTYR